MPPRKTPKLRPIRKVWHKGLASLPLLDGKRRRAGDTRYRIEEIPTGRNAQFDVTPDEVAKLANVLKDDRLARRVVKLREEQFPYGTMPELVCYEFLERKGKQFTYQVQLMGGYRAGGLVPDFIIHEGGVNQVWLIQGIYWHNIPGKREKDIGDKMLLLSTLYNGQPIEKVTFIWENNIMRPDPMRSQVLENALQGIEVGQ